MQQRPRRLEALAVMIFDERLGARPAEEVTRCACELDAGPRTATGVSASPLSLQPRDPRVERVRLAAVGGRRARDSSSGP